MLRSIPVNSWYKNELYRIVNEKYKYLLSVISE